MQRTCKEINEQRPQIMESASRELVSFCPACGGRRVRDLWRNVKNFNVARCLDCRFAFVNPQPTEEALARYYSTQYFMAHAARKGKARTNLIGRDRKRGKQIDQIIRRVMPNATRVCDIGCSFGYTLVALREIGYIVKGYEVSEATAAFARDQFGLEVENQTLPSELNETYDVVIMSGVLEHLAQPAVTMRNIYRSLSRGGLCMIMVPNMGSLNSRLFGRHCSWVSPPDHLSYFTPKCLRTLFVQTGFEIVHAHTELLRGVNFFLALLLALVSASGQEEHLKEQIGGVGDMEKPGFAALAKRLVIQGCRFSYLITYPLWWMVNKIGMGEELFIVGKK